MGQKGQREQEMQLLYPSTFLTNVAFTDIERPVALSSELSL